MGLFGSGKVTRVGTSVVRALDDKNLPDAVKTGLLKALHKEGDIPDYVMEEMLGSMGRRAEHAYRYAKQVYPQGLPFSQTLEVTMGNDEAETVLSGIEGAPVEVDYCNIAPGNALHFSWMKVIADYGYNPTTNELTVLSGQKGYPVYLFNIAPIFPYSMREDYTMETVDQWGESPLAGSTPSRIGMPGGIVQHEPPRFYGQFLTEKVALVYEWDEVTEETVSGVTTTKHNIKQESIYIDSYDLVDDADYIHVKYRVNDTVKYWAYILGSGTYPILDALINQPGQTFGEFFPYVYFRHNKTPIGDDKNNETYKVARKFAKILGMNYDKLHDAIHESPDIADVEQAVLMFAVPMNTEDPLEIRYLFEFFKKMYFTQENQFQFASTEALADIVAQRDESMKNGIVIKDSLFQFALRHSGIFKRMVAGTIGPNGTHTRTYRTESLDYPAYINSDGIQEIITKQVGVNTLRHQVTVGMYEEIELWDMQTVFKVFEYYEAIADEADDILIIPIDRSVTKNYSVRDKEILYARSMHYVFNSRIVIKLKWYQTGFFQAVIFIVAIVMIVFTAGTSLAALGAGVAAGGAAATIAIMVFLQELLVSLVISFAFKAFVKAVGLDAAFLVAILAAMTGAWQYISNGFNMGAPWVQNLVQLVSGLTDAIGKVAKDLMGDLMSDYGSFLADAEAEMDLLKDKQSLLDQKTWLSPFVIFGESPNDFYNRTIHSGNIGVISIEAVTEYVQVALTLPKLAETVGDITYG